MLSIPTVGISACLGQRVCRYNQKKLDSPIPLGILEHINLIDFCPEEEAGLGTPRDPIDSRWNGELQIFQQRKTVNLAPLLRETSLGIIGRIKGADGVVLKSKSPSCGLMDHKIANLKEPDSPLTGNGVLPDLLLQGQYHLIPTTERRLSDPWSLQLWLAGVFQLSELKQYIRTGEPLDEFHQQNEPLLAGLGRLEGLSHLRRDPEKYLRQFALSFLTDIGHQGFLTNLSSKGSKQPFESSARLWPSLQPGSTRNLEDHYPFPNARTFSPSHI